MSAVKFPHQTQQPVNPWRCSSCGQEDPDELHEPAYGFEGEYMGSMVREELAEVLISACCRSPIIDDYEQEKPYDSSDDAYMWAFPYGVEEYV